MKRLALLLASAALGTGCIVSTTSNTGDADVYWSFWQTATHGQFGSLSAKATAVCAQAGVDSITIVLIDPAGVALSPVSGPCINPSDVNDVPGTRFTGLETGTWQFELYGYRGTRLVFEDLPASGSDNTFVVSDGGATPVDTLPEAIYWDLELAFSVPTCISTDTVEFDVVDTGTGHAVYSTYSGANNPPVALGCTAATTTMVIPSVPSATYELANLAQVDQAGADVHAPACFVTWVQSASASVTLPTVTIDSPPPTPALAPACF